MIKLIFIVLCEISAGELTIASEFAKRLPGGNYDLKFLIPEKYGSYLTNKGIKYFGLDISEDPVINKQIFNQFIEDFQPDFLVISDVFTMEYASSWSGINFSNIRQYGVPIIGVDEYEFLTAGYSLDYYGAFFEKLPPLFDSCDYIIRNCPINAVRTVEEKVKCFSLYGQKMVLEKQAKDMVRRKFNLGDHEKLIFYTTSTWEMLNIHRLSALGMLIKWIPVLLQNYFSALDLKVTVIHVGANPWTGLRSKSIKYHHFDNLLPNDFDAYLLASDLFITLNVVSVTLSKAIYGGVPSIVLQNPKLIDFSRLANRVSRMPLWYRNMAEELKIVYPFRAGVFGWHQFLQPVLKDNDYTKTYIEVPLFKMSEVISAFEQYLYNETAVAELRKRQLEYVDRILALPTPDDIMTEIASNRMLKGASL